MGDWTLGSICRKIRNRKKRARRRKRKRKIEEIMTKDQQGEFQKLAAELKKTGTELTSAREVIEKQTNQASSHGGVSRSSKHNTRPTGRQSGHLLTQDDPQRPHRQRGGLGPSRGDGHDDVLVYGDDNPPAGRAKTPLDPDPDEDLPPPYESDPPPQPRARQFHGNNMDDSEEFPPHRRPQRGVNANRPGARYGPGEMPFRPCRS